MQNEKNNVLPGGAGIPATEATFTMTTNNTGGYTVATTASGISNADLDAIGKLPNPYSAESAKKMAHSKWKTIKHKISAGLGLGEAVPKKKLKKKLKYGIVDVKTIKQTQNKQACVQMLKDNDMHKDWFIMVSDPLHLQIDLDDDSDEPEFRKMLAMMEQAIKIKGWRQTPSKSDNKHYIIELKEPLSMYERILLQACLGSDPKRELLSYLGAVSGNSDAVLLIEKREEWPGVESDLDPYEKLTVTTDEPVDNLKSNYDDIEKITLKAIFGSKQNKINNLQHNLKTIEEYLKDNPLTTQAFSYWSAKFNSYQAKLNELTDDGEVEVSIEEVLGTKTKQIEKAFDIQKNIDNVVKVKAKKPLQPMKPSSVTIDMTDDTMIPKQGNPADTECDDVDG